MDSQKQKYFGLKPLGISQQFELIARFGQEQLNHRLGSDRDRLQDIKRLLAFAYSHTEFYHDKFTKAGVHPGDIKTWADFSQKIPFTTKNELREAGIKAVAQRSIPRHVSRTSGSSGAFLAIHQDDTFWIQDSIVEIEAYRKLLGLKASDHSLYATTSPYPYRSVGGVCYRVTYFDNTQPVTDLIQNIRDLRPTVLSIYPSICIDLMRELRRKKIAGSSLGIRIIVTHSEQSTQKLRNQFSAFFGCPVYDEYSAEELGLIALQCKHQTRHIIEGENFCEIVPLDAGAQTGLGTLGEIVGTSLLNYTMPIIRYRQGDLAEITEADCECGVSGRALRELHGRMNDSFVLTDGRVLPSGRLLDWTYGLILLENIDIERFQLVQEDATHAELHIVVGPRFRPKVDDQRIIDSFTSSLTDSMKLTVKSRPVIERTKAGKLIPIISKIS